MSSAARQVMKPRTRVFHFIGHTGPSGFWTTTKVGFSKEKVVELITKNWSNLTARARALRFFGGLYLRSRKASAVKAGQRFIQEADRLDARVAASQEGSGSERSSSPGYTPADPGEKAERRTIPWGGAGVAMVQLPPSADQQPVAGIVCRGCGSLGRVLRGLDLGRIDLAKVDGEEASEAIRSRFASQPGLVVVEWVYCRVLAFSAEDGPSWLWTCPKCAKMSDVSHLALHLREQLNEFIGRWPPEPPGVEQSEVDL